MRENEIRAKMETAVRWVVLGTLAELAGLEIAAHRSSTNLYGVTPQEQEWADKAVLKYARAQEKKWRNWNEAMFEKEEK